MRFMDLVEKEMSVNRAFRDCFVDSFFIFLFFVFFV